jgi:uncharacterized protein YukE
MSPIPDPHEMLAVADRIAAHAQATRGRARQLAAAVAAVDWHGTAADAFHGQAGLVINGLRRSADRLDDAADALRRHADAVMMTLVQLADIGVDVTHLGGHVLHGIRDYLLHPVGLLDDSVSILSDTSHILHDVVGAIRPR